MKTGLSDRIFPEGPRPGAGAVGDEFVVCGSLSRPDSTRAARRGRHAGELRSPPVHAASPLSPSVDASPVANDHHQDREHRIVHGVDDAIVTDTGTQEPGVALQRRHTTGPWGGAETINGRGEATKDVAWQLLQRPLRGWLEVDGVPKRIEHGLEAELSLQLVPAPLARFQKGLPGRFEVHPVLEGLQGRKVLLADKGRHGFSVTFELDALPLVGDAVEGLRDVVPKGRRGQLAHVDIMYVTYVISNIHV